MEFSRDSHNSKVGDWCCSNIAAITVGTLSNVPCTLIQHNTEQYNTEHTTNKQTNRTILDRKNFLQLSNTLVSKALNKTNHILQ